MNIEEERSSCSWTWEQEKMFENAVADYAENLDENLEKFAASVPGKSLEEIVSHYRLLLEDIDAIETCRVPLPNYASSSGDIDVYDNGKGSGHRYGRTDGNISSLKQKRRKAEAWSEEEHRLFLLGLEKHGKGDWRSISRYYVVTRTPTQVASHAQKYFIRLNSCKKDRKRSSIHDITSANIGDVLDSMPVSAQMNSPILLNCNSVDEGLPNQVEPPVHGSDYASTGW